MRARGKVSLCRLQIIFVFITLQDFQQTLYMLSYANAGAHFSKVPITFGARKLIYERKVYLKHSDFVGF